MCAVACAALRYVELASDVASEREVIGRVYPNMHSALVEARKTGYDVLINLHVLRALGIDIELPHERPGFMGEAYFDLLRRGLAAAGRRDLRRTPPGKGGVLVEPWPGAPDAPEAVLEAEELLQPIARLEELDEGEYNAVFGVGLVAVIVEDGDEEKGALAPVELTFRFESQAERSKIEESFARAREGGMEEVFRFCVSHSPPRMSTQSLAIAGLVVCAILLAVYVTRRTRGV